MIEAAAKLKSIKYSAKHNVLRDKKVSDRISRLSDMLNAKGAELFDSSRLKLEMESNKDYLPALELQIWGGKGDKISALKDKRSVAYYPEGGIDVFTPFTLHSEATEVISTGPYRFGSSEDIVRFCDKFVEQKLSFKSDILASYFMSYIFNSFDPADDPADNFDLLNYFKQKNKFGGLGPIAIARIIGLLGGRVEGLHYFDINFTPQAFKVRFLNTKDIQDKRKCGNAVVTFNLNGREKRFWYIQNNFGANND